MVELVNALLNVSRIELGTLAIEPAPTDFVEVLDSVILELKPDLVKKKINLKKKYAKLPKILIDAKLLRIIVQNLLTNAVKYTPDKGSISVGLEKSATDVLINVADTGYGIPKSQQSQIFTKLFRADNVKIKDTQGTGLGLYMTQSVVKMLKGEIHFDSKENKGTTFIVSLPLSGIIKREGTKGLEESKY